MSAVNLPPEYCMHSRWLGILFSSIMSTYEKHDNIRDQQNCCRFYCRLDGLKVDFTIKNNQILFGLSAIKNLGDSAIRNIIENRNRFGTFKSLSDLCDRLPSNVLNKRSLESLIHCGALDEFSNDNNF